MIIGLLQAVRLLVLVDARLIHGIAHLLDPIAELVIELVVNDGVRRVRQVDTAQREIDRGGERHEHDAREPAKHLRVRVPEAPRSTIDHPERRSCLSREAGVP